MSESITVLFDQLRQGDSEAAAKLWEAYSRQLVDLAARQLASTKRRVADEDDVANSVFYALCSGAERGRFPDIHNREDLWRLLLAVTKRKVIDHTRRNTAQKRGGGKVRGESVFDAAQRDADGFDALASAEPDPELLCELDEIFQRLLSVLRDDQQRQIALWRMEGYTNQEIAEKLSVTERTIERKLRLIRGDWQKLIDAEQRPE